MNSVSKTCGKCQAEKPLTDFYVRAQYRENPTLPGHYGTECKTCMLARNREGRKKDKTLAHIPTEQIALDWFKANGIPALPGKSVAYSSVDIVVFGCIRVEVKYSKPSGNKDNLHFNFTASTLQRRRGFLAEIVVLICDYGDKRTFHLFRSSNPVFYMNDRLKYAVMYTVGDIVPRKHGNNRVVMTQPMMDEAQDNLKLIYDVLVEYCNRLRESV